MKQLKALITGINGQDGSYLAELLINKGYEVHGIIRRNSQDNLGLIKHLEKDLNLHFGDLLNTSLIHDIIEKVKPDEVYNLGAQSHVGVSFEVPEYTCDVVGLGALRLLEALRRICPNAKYYQASSSEMFGKVVETPQNEKTPFYPRSPYGCAKVFAYWMTKNYRESFDMFACNGILFNHESPRRGLDFVTRKITSGLAKIFVDQEGFIELGNLDSKRDWGHASDYVRVMWAMLQKDHPDDYVIATGETRSVREFVEIACEYFDFEIEWKGKGVDEVGIDKKTGNVIIKINKKFYRPAEVDLLIGDASKADKELYWIKQYTFKQLVEQMCDNDFQLNKTNKN